MASLSTHVLDTTTGTPARGLRVELREEHGGLIADEATDADGRVKNLCGEAPLGLYSATFHTAEYFQSQGQSGFYPKVSIEFRVGNDAHYHIPLLLSPFGYSTYRGT